MIVRCQRDNTTFEAVVVSYPTKMYSADGDSYIECPTCRRRYFFHPETDIWSSDRDLEIISQEAKR